MSSIDVARCWVFQPCGCCLCRVSVPVVPIPSRRHRRPACGPGLRRRQRGLSRHRSSRSANVSTILLSVQGQSWRPYSRAGSAALYSSVCMGILAGPAPRDTRPIPTGFAAFPFLFSCSFHASRISLFGLASPFLFLSQASHTRSRYLLGYRQEPLNRAWKNARIRTPGFIL